MSTYKAYKLEGRKVVLSENGVSKVIIPPVGICFSEIRNTWQANILDDEGNWMAVRYSANTHGFMEALQMAMDVRELSLTFLLNVRMLPRLRKAYDIKEVGGLYRVRDPIEKCYKFFTSRKFAEAFNKEVTAKWVDKHTFDTNEMVQPYMPTIPLVRMDYLTAISPAASRSIH